MTIKVKAQERKLMVGPRAGRYVYQMTPEKYSSLSESKMIEEASLRSGIQRGALQAAFTACGDVIKAWATEGHSVPVPGLGTMRFGLNAKGVEDVNMVASSLITTRKIIFVPSVEVKKELMNTPVNITCYDRNGKVVKRVNSSDSGSVEDPEAEKFLLTVASNNEAWGSVEGGGEYAEGTEVNIVATPKSGYKFTKWSDGNTNASRTYVTKAEAETLTATFAADAGDDLGQ